MKGKHLIIAFITIFLIVNFVSCTNSSSVKLVENTEDIIFEPEDKSAKLENINGNIDVGQIRIVTGETLKVEANKVKEDECEISIENGTLSINYDTEVKQLINRNEEFIITIPEGFTFENLDFKIGCGDVKNQTLLNAKCINLDIGVGEVKLNNIKNEMFTVNIGTGDIEVSGDITNSLNVNTGVGDVVINLERILNDYNMNLETSLGEIKVGTETYMGSYSRNNDSVKKSIKASSGVGDVAVNV